MCFLILILHNIVASDLYLLLNMDFNPEEFLQDVTWEGFDVLRKPELMSLAKYLDLDVKHAMRKQVIKNMLIDSLVEDDLLDEFDLDNKIDVEGSDTKFKELQIKEQLQMQKEIELAKLQMQEKERLDKLAFEQQKWALEKQKLDMQEQERKDKLVQEEKEREERLKIEKEEKEKRLKWKKE